VSETPRHDDPVGRVISGGVGATDQEEARRQTDHIVKQQKRLPSRLVVALLCSLWLVAALAVVAALVRIVTVVL
jgi:hypothetical protein